jgi:hypothetical protein
VSGTAAQDTEITFNYELVKYNITVTDVVKEFDSYADDGTIIWKTKSTTKRSTEQQKRYYEYSYAALTEGDYASYVLESVSPSASGELLDNTEIIFTYRDESNVPAPEHYVTVTDEFYDQNGNVKKVERPKEKYKEGFTYSFTALTGEALDKAAGKDGYVLEGEATVSKTIGTTDDTVTFTYKYSKYTVTVKDVYYDINGNLVDTKTRESNDYVQGTELSYSALGGEITDSNGNKYVQASYKGKNYNLDGDQTRTVTVGDSDQTVTFKYYYEKERIEATVSNKLDDATVTYVDAIKAKKNNAIQKPVPSKVVLNGKTLKNKTDYTVTYQNESGEVVDGLKESGVYYMILTGTENTAKGKTTYTGSQVLPITVMTNDTISMNTVKVTVNTVEWTGNPITEGIIKSVKCGSDELKEGTHYTVNYDNTENSGKQTITLTAIAGSGYVGTKTVTVNVKGTAMSKVKVAGITAVDYNGEGDLQQDIYDLKLTYTYKEKGKTQTEELTLDEDYTVSYENNNKAGTAKIVFTGKGKYNGTLKKSFKINKVTLATTDKKTKEQTLNEAIEIESSLEATADKKKGAQLKDLVVSYNGEELKLGTDYTVSYKNNKADATTAAKWATQKKPKYPQVIIKGKGNYQGSITLNFEITDN